MREKTVELASSFFSLSTMSNLIIVNSKIPQKLEKFEPGEDEEREENTSEEEAELAENLLHHHRRRNHLLLN